MKTILVPTDFSKCAQWALEVATDMALRADAQIILLHMVQYPIPDINVESSMSEDESWPDKLFALELMQGHKVLLAQAANYAEERGVFVTCELRSGDAFHGIVKVIGDQEVDLVVMGASGHSTLEERIAGSTTRKVVRYARCPVLTVHEKPAKCDFVNIVYATCLSENEIGFSDVVHVAQGMYGATVHLVRINTPMNFQSDHISKKAMQEFARKTHLENYTLNVFSDRSEEEGILHFALSINADLIAMATHGRTGFAQALAASIAEDVVSHSGWPVLTNVIAQYQA